MAARIRELDWAATPLGPIAAWSDRLRLMVEQVLASPVISSLVCGPGRLLIYNEAAARLYGARHPAALGSRLPDVFPEGWATVAPLYARAFAGESLEVTALPLDIRGQGDLACNMFDALLVPVREADGQVAYVHMTGMEASDRLRAEAALRASEAQYREMFDAIDEGFCTVEMMFDTAGRAQDYRFVSVNAAFEQQTGLRDAVGRRMRDLVPAHEADWFEAYGRIAQTGVSERFEHRSEALGRWYDVFAFRVGAPGQHRVGMLFKDIRARKAAEAGLRERARQQALLVALGDAIRIVSDPVDLQHTAMRLLGEHLGLSRAYYFEIVRERGFEMMRERGFEVMRERGGWVHVIDAAWQRAPDAPGVIGPHALADFGAAMFEGFARGEVIAVADVSALPDVTPAELASYRALGVTAFINVPLLRHGQYTAGIGAHSDRPHVWAEAEIDLIGEVAARTWTAVERARAEASSHESEQRYHALFTASPVPFLALAPDAPNFTITAANDACLAATMTTRAQIVGRRVCDVFTDDPGRPDARGPQVLRDSLYRVLASGLPDALPRNRYDMARPDGGFEERWWLAISAPVFNASGQIRTIIHQVTDATGLHFAEIAERDARERQAFLLKLSDGLRPLKDAADIKRVAACCVAEHLGVAMAAYFEFDQGGRGTIAEGHGRTPIAVRPGTRLADFGPQAAGELRAGRSFAFEDAETDPRLDGHRSAYRALDARAGVGVPLIKAATFIAALAVSDTVPRRWSEAELQLLQDVAERTWDAVERARAETALRQSEEMLAADLAHAELLRGLAERLVTEENVRTIYDEILAAAIAVSRSDAGTVQVFDADTQSLSLLTTHNMAPALTDRFHTVDATSRTACGIALKTGQRSFVEFADESADAGCALLAGAGFASALAIPLVSRSGRRLGMLNTQWRARGHRPTERQLRFLDLIARQAADLIGQRQGQSVLRESEERLRQFGEASLDILWIRDAATLQWTYLTPAFEPIYGLSRDEALTGDNYRNWQDLILPEDRAYAVGSIDRVRAGERVTFEYRICRPDGQIRWLRNTDFPMRDQTGRVTQIGGVGHDVTALKAIQAAMANNETRLRTLMEGIPQLVWRSCDKGLWTWSSPQWAAFTGQTLEESQGGGWLAVVHPDDRAVAELAWDDARARGRLDVEHRVRRASDGAWLWHRTLSVPVRAVPAAGGTQGAIVEWLGTTTDIENFKRMQGEQQVLVAELQHRTRNLLAVVRNVARRSLGPSPGRDDYDARLSALGRVQGFLSRSTAYSASLADVVEAELHAAGDGASDKVEITGPEVDLPGESVQAVALALHELATNAVKYGAIAQPSARLAVQWRIDAAAGEAACLVIDWHESRVVMPAGPPQRRGYGSELITRALPYQLGAKTTLEFAHDGVRCRIVLPASAFSLH